MAIFLLVIRDIVLRPRQPLRLPCRELPGTALRIFLQAATEAAGMITMALLFALYFLPTIVASNRGRRVGGILILNLLFGWTGVGWFALLLYALLATPRIYAYAPGMYAPASGWQRF